MTTTRKETLTPVKSALSHPSNNPTKNLPAKRASTKGTPLMSSTASFVVAPKVRPDSDLLDRLVAFRPIRTETMDTKNGIVDATITEVVVVDDDGRFEYMGQRPIFWRYVRLQLAEATPESPWVAGRLAKSGHAYTLDEVTAEEHELIQVALEAGDSF